MAYNTEVERNFLKTTFEFRSVAEEVVGCGVDLMQDQAGPDDPEPEDDEELHKRLAPHLRARGAQFRRRHRLQGQFLLYGGRIDAGKGCEELIEYFTSYKEQGGEAQLALSAPQTRDEWARIKVEDNGDLVISKNQYFEGHWKRKK